MPRHHHHRLVKGGGRTLDVGRDEVGSCARKRIQNSPTVVESARAVGVVTAPRWWRVLLPVCCGGCQISVAVLFASCLGLEVGGVVNWDRNPPSGCRIGYRSNLTAPLRRARQHTRRGCARSPPHAAHRTTGTRFFFLVPRRLRARLRFGLGAGLPSRPVLAAPTATPVAASART